MLLMMMLWRLLMVVMVGVLRERHGEGWEVRLLVHKATLVIWCHRRRRNGRHGREHHRLIDLRVHPRHRWIHIRTRDVVVMVARERTRSRQATNATDRRNRAWVIVHWRRYLEQARGGHLGKDILRTTAHIWWKTLLTDAVDEDGYW